MKAAPPLRGRSDERCEKENSAQHRFQHGHTIEAYQPWPVDASRGTSTRYNTIEYWTGQTVGDVDCSMACSSLTSSASTTSTRTPGGRHAERVDPVAGQRSAATGFSDGRRHRKPRLRPDRQSHLRAAVSVRPTSCSIIWVAAGSKAPGTSSPVTWTAPPKPWACREQVNMTAATTRPKNICRSCFTSSGKAVGREARCSAAGAKAYLRQPGKSAQGRKASSPGRGLSPLRAVTAR